MVNTTGAASWLRDYFTEHVYYAFAADRAFVKHPCGRWTECTFVEPPVFFSERSAYFGAPLPPPRDDGHRVTIATCDPKEAYPHG